MRKTLVAAALIGAAASIPASKFKAITESPLQRAAEALWSPTEQDRELVGTDPTGHLENMPPAVLADRVARCLGHGPFTVPEKLRIQNVVHYGFGALSGAAYGVLAEAFPPVTAGAGTVAGAAIYAASHGTVLPLLRVQEPPWRLPRAAFAWEFTSHLLFGLVLELARRSGRYWLGADRRNRTRGHRGVARPRCATRRRTAGVVPLPARTSRRTASPLAR